MEWKLPILLIAQKKFLESLKEGSLYLTNSLCYQNIDDKQRGDKFDSAIKSDFLKIKNCNNGRIMSLTTYIKCFYHYRQKNIELLSSDLLALHISKESVSSLLEISRSTDGYAMLIYDVEEFIRRFIKKCDEMQYSYYFSDVKYIDESEYFKYEQKMHDFISGKTDKCLNPVFIKRDAYMAQQEFRIAVNLPCQSFEKNKDYKICVPKSLVIDIPSIADISDIAKLQDIIDNPWIIGKEEKCIHL